MNVKKHSSVIALALLASLLVEGMSVSALVEVNPLLTYQDYFLSIYYRLKKKMLSILLFQVFAISWWQIEYLFWFYF